MAPPDNQGQGQEDNEGQGTTVKLKIPLFRGGLANKDTLSTRAWCEAVDRQQTQQNWNEQVTALAAIDAFREGVAEWFNVIREEKPNEVNLSLIHI